MNKPENAVKIADTTEQVGMLVKAMNELGYKAVAISETPSGRYIIIFEYAG